MSLAVDCVGGECDVNVAGLGFLCNASIDTRWDVVSKRGGAWVFHYIKSAYTLRIRCASVRLGMILPDVTLRFSDWSRSVADDTMDRIYRSSHSFTRKFLTRVQLVYQTLQPDLPRTFTFYWTKFVLAT